MMNVSVGVDLEPVCRFENLERKERLSQKVFSEQELEFSFSRANTAQHLAGRFVAKEATFKALDQIPHIESTDITRIEVLRSDPQSPPELRIEGEAVKEVQSSLSISHTEELAIAVVFILSR